MNLNLIRKSYNPWGVIGELQNDAGDILFVTLEHGYPQEDGSVTAKLNAGTHNCVLGTHQLSNGIPFKTYEIQDVPGCTGILLHPGNYENDSHGCILLGKSLGDQMILHSKEAFEEFMAMTNGCASFTLTVTE